MVRPGPVESIMTNIKLPTNIISSSAVRVC